MKFSPARPGGVIMDVMNKEQAKIAEEAGACAVMALERIPADIRQSKGVARMSDPKMIKDWRPEGCGTCLVNRVGKIAVRRSADV